MKTLSSEAAAELKALAGSSALKKDMEQVARNRRDLMRTEAMDADAYVEFVAQFNEFINHEQRKFSPIVDRDMRL